MLSAGAFASLADVHAATDQPEVVYLNFSDGTEAITFAPIDDATTNRSSLGVAAPYPAFAWPTIGTGVETRAEVIARITRKVHALFLPYNVLVTLKRPATGPYTTVMIGGGPRDIGIDQNLGGVAYMDCGNQEDANLVFAFPSNLRGSEQGLVFTIAQEAAHAFGLEHTESRRDVMYPELAPEQVGFLDEDTAILGERLCGNTTQNSHRKLIEMVGPWLGDEKPFDDGAGVDREPPTLSLVSPADGATVAQPFLLEAAALDAGGIDRVTLSLTPGTSPAELAVLRRPPFSFSLGGLPAGPLAVSLTAYDRSGNATTVAATLNLLADQAPPPGPPACAFAPPTAPPWVFVTFAGFWASMVLVAHWRRRRKGLARCGAGRDRARVIAGVRSCAAPTGPL
ncbi:MAG TPA: Ig-like domain-containing protein [Polyangia bacterium]